MKYTRGNPGDFARYIKAQPDVAAARSHMAETYRSIRRDNPVMARLLRRLMAKAEAQVADDFWNTFDSGDSAYGLGDLLR